jgi:uncharacterized protein YbaR (Trm112 family)
MPISRELLDILVCPITRSRLTEADQESTQRLRDRLESGEAKPRGSMDWKVSQVTGFLVTEDGSHAYAVIDGVPNLLPSSSIPR